MVKNGEGEWVRKRRIERGKRAMAGERDISQVT
jgi:hypothetical protein